MNNVQLMGKYLDQPMLVGKFQKTVPALLGGAALTYTAMETVKAEKGERRNTAVKTGITSAFAALSAFLAPFAASKITKRELSSGLSKIKENNGQIVDSFIKKANITDKTKEILNKSKNEVLNTKEIKTIFEELAKNKTGKEFLEKLIPSPKNVSAKKIFSEIGFLSVYGAIPVAGGIAGGIAADKITEPDNWKNKIPNKIKEGTYQFLANIFMCNVGAGAALGILEKNGIKSKAARAIGMTSGIILTGIVGGSKIANFIGKKFINPLFKNNEEGKERTPELLDIGLHTDDIATVSLLSGLKWIEPSLPLLYGISGYRAGIGYRN